jgi:hypothetical protein
MSDTLNTLTVVLWLATGALWLRASTVAVPTNLQSGYGALVGIDEMSLGFKRQAFWNKWAAVASCAAALMQAAAVVCAFKHGNP